MSTIPSNISTFQSGSRAVIRTKTVYDANGRVVALIDDRGAQTTYQYDLLDRQTSMTFQDGSTRTNAYDLANDLTGCTDENGSVFANTFDSLGRQTATAITLATGVVGTTAQSFQYDGLSRLTFARDTVGSTNVDVNFYYDALNWVVEESQQLGTDTTHIGYVTHSAFTSYVVTELTYPNTRKVTYGYDSLYRRNTINETSGGASIAAWQFFGYRTASVALGNNITCSFMNNDGDRSAIQAGLATPPWGTTLDADRLGYDGSGRMIAKRFLSIADTPNTIGFTTEYDPASNKLYERALHAESRSALYPSYDSINRLLKYQRGVLASGGESISTPITLPGTDSQRSYDLDHLGNWKNTVFTPEGGTSTTEVRRHNLVNEVTKFGSTPVLYDHGNNIASPDPLIAARGNGNIADDGTFSYQYDALNRLTTVMSGSSTVNDYTYDALGRFVATPEFRSLWEGQQIVEVQTIENVTAHQHVWGQYIDELVQLKAYGDSAATDYVLQDLLYRSVAMTSSSATIVEAYDYDAYGNTLMYNAGSGGAWFTDGDNPVSGTNNPYLFTGRQYDNTVKIYYYRWRFYHPGLGRFLSRDPIDYDDGMNLHELENSSPTTFLDPMGTARWYQGWGDVLPVLWRRADPKLQAVFDQTVSDRVNGLGEGVGVNGLSAKLGGTSYIFDTEQRDKAKCFSCCMSAFNKQAAILLLGGGIGYQVMTPVDKSLLAETYETLGMSELADSTLANAANILKSDTTSAMRGFSVISRERTGASQMAKMLQDLARGGKNARGAFRGLKSAWGKARPAVAAILALEIAVGAYCYNTCEDDPCSC